MKSPRTATKQAPPRASYLVKQLERALRARIDAIVQPLGLTAVQYTALSVLARHPGMSSAQLARRSFVSAQAANELVSALERRGLIRRRSDRDGGRALGIYLTAAGEKALARCDADVDLLEAELFRGVAKKDEVRFMRMLRECRESVQGPARNPNVTGGDGDDSGAPVGRRRLLARTAQ
jgi:DNA-binding MarR family transcriptional regulator